jgi:sugar phosphate permease
VLSALLLAVGLHPPIVIFALLWFLNGAGPALIAIPSAMLLAEHTAEDERGRAYAAHFALTHAFWLITYPAIGYGTSSLGAPMTFTIAGAICLLVTSLVFASSTSPIRTTSQLFLAGVPRPMRQLASNGDSFGTQPVTALREATPNG